MQTHTKTSKIELGQMKNRSLMSYKLFPQKIERAFASVSENKNSPFKASFVKNYDLLQKTVL